MKNLLTLAGRERLLTVVTESNQAPAVADHAPVTLSDRFIVGDDCYGIVVLKGCPNSTGLIADITFSTDIPYGNVPGGRASYQVPAVTLTPIVITGVTSSLAAKVDVYPEVPAGPTKSGWSLGFATAPGSGFDGAWVYQVVQL